MNTPDTTGFMQLGYAVILGTMLLHFFSIVRRERSAREEIEFLEELNKK